MTTKPTSTYMINSDVSCREEGPDGALLFNPDKDEILVINTTGLLIWRALATPSSENEIVKSLIEQCNNVPQNEITQDVHEFVEKLLAKEFVTLTEGK